MTNIIIWNENIHEVENEEVKKIYPKGIHGCIKDFLSTDNSLKIKTATLKEDQNGLSEELLKNCDVVIWWGHKAHDEVCLLYTSPSPRDRIRSRMPSSA